MGGFAWVTLATNDSYSLGALVLAHSLRCVGTKYDIAVLVTPGVTGAMREKLSSVFSLVQEVNVLDSKDEANLALLARPELGITFTKLHCWRLTQYEKCVFVDADTLVVRNCDELFEREELSAAPDVGWPDCFNSGVFVFKPSQQTFASITAFAAAKGSFDGGDQGLLNQYFSDWSHKDISKHLPFIYNMCSTATYSYLPAFKQFGDDVRIIHFIGITKPWLQYFDTLTGQVQPAPGTNHLQPLLQLWWNIFCEKVHPQLSPVMASSTLASVWHELNPLPSVNSLPRIIHDDFNDFVAYDSIEPRVPDFSEFQDPWDDYSRPSKNDNYHRQIGQNESSQFFSSRTSEPTQYVASEIRDKRDEYRAPSVPDNRQRNEVQDSSKIYHEASTERQTFTVADHPSEDRHHRETNWHTQDPSQSASNVEIHRHDTQSDRNEEQEYRHNDQNNYNHEQDYRGNEQKNCNREQDCRVNEQKNFNREQDCRGNEQKNCNREQDCRGNEQKNCNREQDYQGDEQRNCNRDERYDAVHEQHEHRHHDDAFESAHQNRGDNFHREDERPAHDHAQSPSRSLTGDCRETTVNQSNAYSEENERRNERDRLEDRSNIDSHKEPTDLRTNESHSPPEPCTKSKSIATQSEPNIAGQLESNDAGIAGALAKITLGEARSPEQVAFEEHMRKQSWEQGQIDYMGRDSFDNIWKKISETLAVQPKRQPSPPKTVAKPDKGEIEVAAPITTEDVPASKSEAAALPEIRRKEEQDLMSELAPALAKILPPCAESTSGEKSAETIPPQSSSSDAAVPAVALAATVPQLPPMESVEPPTQKNDNETSILTSTTTSTLPSTPCERFIEYVKLEEQPAKTAFPETPAAAVLEAEKTTESQKEAKIETPESDSEIVSESPVPIQVAESVLEAEVKESVTEDLRPLTEEAISSISMPAHEFVPAVLETTMQAVGPSTPTPNGSAGLGTEIGNGIDALNLSSLPGVTSSLSAVPEISPEVASVQAPEVASAGRSEEACPLPVRPVESVPESRPTVETEQSSISTVESVEKAREVELPVEPVEKPREVELPVESLEKPKEVTVATTQPTSHPVEIVEKVPEATVVAETERTSRSSVPAEKPVESGLPAMAAEHSLPMAETKPTKPEPVVCPMKPERKVAESELPTKSEEPSSLPVAAPVVESSIASTPQESIEKKVPKDERRESEVASEEAASQSESSEESPVRPARTKEVQIPGTPIVIEATPPTSPPIGAVQAFEEKPTKVTKKVVKKVVKKTTSGETKPAEGAEADAEGKKVTKKVVKKVVKKTKEDDPAAAESSSGNEKPKKVVKVVKKTTKTTQSLETDTTVPETPPPGTSEVPVPPKRKLKTTAKTTPAKNDSEP